MEQNKWNGNNYNSIYEESVSFLDGILEQLFINQYLWIYCIIYTESCR